MGLTALQENGAGLGAAATSDYRGSTSAQHFGDPQAEGESLRSGCGVYDLGFRAKISLTGPDRVRWLNGMVTNNVRDLAAGRGVYAFLLNPQGHILGDMFTYNRGESITVDTDINQAEKILSTFDHYIIMDDVEVKNLSDDLTALGVAGPQAVKVLAGAGLAVSELQPLQLQNVTWDGVESTIIRGEDDPNASYEIWLPPSAVRRSWDALVAAGATRVGSDAIELHRIMSGIPRYGVDIRERDLPQETEQARALNFNKGCYVGQEIVERIRSRGMVHRKFSGFVADAAVVPGTKILAGEKEVGEVTSAASATISDREIHVALGYIRREVGTPGRDVMIGPTRARVASLPFTDALPQAERSLEERPA